MYALYGKEYSDAQTHYVFDKETHLFGCNVGWIPKLLRGLLSSSASEPLKWNISVGSALEQAGFPARTLVINLKPNGKKPNLSLYEVMAVWGWSSHEWTPIMFHLRGLFIDDDPTEFESTDFYRSDRDVEDPIFSMMYLEGSVRNGKLFGPWTPPRPGSTNSVLLWPDCLKYFWDEAAKLMQ